MPDIELVKTDTGLLGTTPADQKAWKKFKSLLERLGAGEFLSISYRRPRLNWFHRKFFALLNTGFEHWETGRKRKTYKGRPVEANFEQFREDITIMAGFYEQTFNLRGQMKLRAKSISFANMEQEEFEALYDAVAKVLLEHVLTNYKREDLDHVVEQIMNFTHGAA